MRVLSTPLCVPRLCCPTRKTIKRNEEKKNGKEGRHNTFTSIVWIVPFFDTSQGKKKPLGAAGELRCFCFSHTHTISFTRADDPPSLHINTSKDYLYNTVSNKELEVCFYGLEESNLGWHLKNISRKKKTKVKHFFSFPFWNVWID